MRRNPVLGITCILAAALQLSHAACLYQWKLEIAQGKDRKGRQRPPREIGLWIPPKCEYVKGVLCGGQTLLERSFLKEPKIRECAARNNLAIVFPSGPSLGTLAKFAEKSGYAELKTAPFITIGHSAGGIGARNAAYLEPKRAIGVLHFHSGNYHHGIPGKGLTLAGIPFLAVNGEFEEYAPDCGFKKETGWGLETQWIYGKKQLTDLQRKDPDHLFTMLIEPGAGHFSYLPQTVDYVVLYIDKLCKARLQPGRSHELKTVKPDQGWLMDAELKEPKFAAAAHGDYKGKREDAFWAFDRELAEATVEYHKALGGKDQHVTFGSGGKPIFGNAHRPGVPFVPVPGTDGRVFKVEGAYLKKGMKNSRQAGQDMTHAPGPIEFKVIDGPFEYLGGGKFRILFRGSTNPGRGAVLMAYHPGDDTYRYAEHPGFVRFSFGVKKGNEQKIEFPAINDLKVGATVKLKAKSDSGLPVEYAVAAGPAEIVNGDTLKICPVPPRSKLPVEVKVVAWQWGKEGENGVRAARPVAQIVRIVGK